MTSREDLIRQRDEAIEALRKLDATPWEERMRDPGSPATKLPALQLIACVRALRALLAETTSACEPHSQAAIAATKALEELDAL